MRMQGMLRRGLQCLMTVGLLAVITGCGTSYPKCIRVEGCVTYQGKPVKAGIVNFVPVSQISEGKLVRPATGDLKANGSYTMRTFREGEGVLPGKYAVTIEAYDYSQKRDALQRLPSLIPIKYNSATTSGLEATIPADASGTLEMDFTLTD